MIVSAIAKFNTFGKSYGKSLKWANNKENFACANLEVKHKKVCKPQNK